MPEYEGLSGDVWYIENTACSSAVKSAWVFRISDRAFPVKSKGPAGERILTNHLDPIICFGSAIGKRR